MSKLFRLNFKDVGKAIVVAVLAAIYAGLTNELTAHGLDFSSYNWMGMLDLAETAAVAYISKNFLSNDEGKFLGKV